MSIKHDNIVPSVWPGVEESTGVPTAILSTVEPATRGTVRYFNSRGQDQQATIVAETLPPQALPPPANYQVAGNANSTDYSCQSEAREKILEEPVPPPRVIVTVLGFYANDNSMPLGYDPTIPAQQLVVNSDFWVNLRIQPSVGLDGFDPTIFFLNNNIDGTDYASPSGFPGWFAGDGASNFGGSVYKIPSFYIPQVGQATMTFTAGQPTINPIFARAAGSIPIVAAPSIVIATVEQQGWFPGVPAPIISVSPSDTPVDPTSDANVDTVNVYQTLQLAVVGPPSTSYTYVLPWGVTGSSTTDVNGRDVILGTALQAGTWPFTVIFAGIAPVQKTFLVLDAYTSEGGFEGDTDADADADASNSADGDGDGDGDGGDGSGDGGDGGGGDGGGGGGGGAM
jgi:uncharacterized membrane protein YgcG